MAWDSSDDDDDFGLVGGGLEHGAPRAPTVFDLSPRSDAADEYDAEYLERTSGALAAQLAHVDALLHARSDADAEAEARNADDGRARARAHSPFAAGATRRPIIDRDTGLVIPHGTTPASERATECARWRRAFPHLHAVGTRVEPPPGWQPLADLDPRALTTNSKQPSAAGADAHYALDHMEAPGALAARDSLQVTGSCLALAEPPKDGAERGEITCAETAADVAAELDPAGEELIAAHGKVDDVFAVDVETREDRAWASARPELTHAARQARALERWGIPPLSPDLDDERLDAATHHVWRAIVQALEPHIAALAPALAGRQSPPPAGAAEGGGGSAGAGDKAPPRAAPFSAHGGGASAGALSEAVTRTHVASTCAGPAPPAARAHVRGRAACAHARELHAPGAVQPAPQHVMPRDVRATASHAPPAPTAALTVTHTPRAAGSSELGPFVAEAKANLRTHALVNRALPGAKLQRGSRGSALAAATSAHGACCRRAASGAPSSACGAGGARSHALSAERSCADAAAIASVYAPSDASVAFCSAHFLHSALAPVPRTMASHGARARAPPARTPPQTHAQARSAASATAARAPLSPARVRAPSAGGQPRVLARASGAQQAARTAGRPGGV
ncbi:hypothetical protein KFE25_006314 [Diacronema lutheri]|uniref:Uncharacterized protein n=1 Tax=Diacronema lutheri TaxID=2081491 RepID=A0A8J5XST1_DIALT|nr:hypothetical protein KFE25_006314 [Diacronema lutheri]